MQEPTDIPELKLFCQEERETPQDDVQGHTSY